MTNDLISREALKEIFLQDRCGDNFLPKHFVVSTIDNAPTEPQITVCCENADEKTIEELKAELERVINEVRPPQGEWGKWIIAEIQCPNCFEYFETDCYSTEELNKCPNCGADMRGEPCSHDCDKCEHGVPIDGQFYDDGLPIHECGIPVKKNLRDKKGADK